VSYIRANYSSMTPRAWLCTIMLRSRLNRSKLIAAPSMTASWITDRMTNCGPAALATNVNWLCDSSRLLC